MLKNKFISLVVIFIMAANFITVYSANATALDSYDYETNIVKELDSVLNTDNCPFIPEQETTRAIFVANVIKLMGYDEVAQSIAAETVFSDVDVAAWYTPYITLAHRMGYIKGEYDALFYPDEKITYAQSLKIITIALGYEQMAEAKGDYPAGYVTVASDIGITKGISKSLGSTVTQQEMAKIIFNALHAKMLKVNKLSDNRVTYTEDGTVLETVRNIYIATGILTENSKTALSGDSNLHSNEVIINDELYLTGTTGAAQLLGYNVKLYYYLDEETSNKTILYIEQKNTQFIRIESEDINTGGSTFYNYYNGNADTKVNISSKANVLYNGRVGNNLKESDFIPENGNVTLIDNNNDGVFDVVFISSYTTIVVKSFVKGVLYDLYDETKNIYLNEDSETMEVIVQDSGGTVRDLDFISEWDVLMIYKSYDFNHKKDVYEIVVSSSMEKGEVASINDTDVENEKVIEIQVDSRGFYSKKYYTSKILPKESLIDVKKGANVEFCLDPDGKIAAIRNVATISEKFAFYFAGESDIGGVSLKLFTENNKIEIVNCKAKVLIDTVPKEGKDVITQLNLAAESDSTGAGRMIWYRINGKGLITEIDTTLQNENEFTQNFKGESVYNGLRSASYTWSQRYKSKTMTFSGRFNISANTDVFLIPGDISQEDLFDYKTSSYFSNDKDYKIVAYYKGYDQVRAPMVTIVSNASANLGYNDYPAYVRNIYKATNEEGEEGYKISVYFGTGTKELFVNSDAEMEKCNISVGDIVRFTIGSKNEINYIEKLLDADELTLYKNGAPVTVHYFTSDTQFSYTDSYFVVFGKVLTKTDDIIRVDINQSLSPLSFILGNSAIYKLDTNYNGKLVVEPSSVTNIIPEDRFPNDSSYVFMHIRYGEVISALIVK